MSRKRKAQRTVNNAVCASKPSANVSTVSQHLVLFERMVVCNDCGQYCGREEAHGEAYWGCKSENRLQSCTSTPVPESILLQLTENVLETPTITPDQIKGMLQEIRLFQDRKLIFMLQDDRNYAYVWQERGTDTTKSTKRSDTRKIHMLDTVQQPFIEKEPNDTAVRSCRFCGKPFALTRSNRMKRFCSEKCRQSWWRSHQGTITQKTAVSVCVNCGLVFKNGGNTKRRFCSRTCYFNFRFGERE